MQHPIHPPTHPPSLGSTLCLPSPAISQYRYVLHYVEAGWPLPTWSQFCADPFVFGDMVLQAHAAGQRCCSHKAEHQYVHVLPQAHCFTTAANEPVSPAPGGAWREAVGWAGGWHALKCRCCVTSFSLPQLPCHVLQPSARAPSRPLAHLSALHLFCGCPLVPHLRLALLRRPLTGWGGWSILKQAAGMRAPPAGAAAWTPLLLSPGPGLAQ